MALYHFHATQVKRSAGQSAIAAAAYRAGERLYSEYYGEYSDYTRKNGVICSDIFLPDHAPREYADRQTLWNAVEKVEKNKKAQLAYSFDIALQNELTLEENIALARQFLMEQFVRRGMIVDFAIHAPDPKDGGIENPHFHVLCPIRPMEQDGTWGKKQRREYVLDENGNRILDEAGNYVFNAVPTTDWGSPETLEAWRAAWAELCNAKFAEKGLSCRIDHRSYARQGSDQIPTVHEGPAVREMERKGIRTNKGDLNRLIRSANHALRSLLKQLAELKERFHAARAALAQPRSPTAASLLNRYYDQRNAGAYSNKARVNNLKKLSQQVLFMEQYGIVTLDDLESVIDDLSARVHALNDSMKAKSDRRKDLKALMDAAKNYAETKPVVDGLKKIKFKKAREKYKEEHRREFTIYYASRRTLDKLLAGEPDQKLHPKAWQQDRDRLEQEYRAEYEKLKPLREELMQLRQIQNAIDSVARGYGHSVNRNALEL